MKRVVVTGLGIVSSIGNNAEEVTESLRHARSGIVAAVGGAPPMTLVSNVPSRRTGMSGQSLTLTVGTAVPAVPASKP